MSSSFTPMFSDIVDSSLWLESDLVVKVFMTMLAKQDRDYVVRASAFNIARWANKTEEEVLKALKILQAPDTKRVEKQDFEGRRVKKVDDGWLNLNGEKYARKMRLLFERARKAQWAREHRAKGPALPGSGLNDAMIAAGGEALGGETFLPESADAAAEVTF